MKKSDVERIKRKANLSGWNKFNDKVRFKVKKIRPIIGYEDCGLCKEGFIFENLYKVIIERDAEPFPVTKSFCICKNCIVSNILIYHIDKPGKSIDTIISAIINYILSDEQKEIEIKTKFNDILAQIEFEIKERDKQLKDLWDIMQDE